MALVSKARPSFESKPNPHVNRNVQFIDGPVNHLSKAEDGGPSGAAPGLPNPAFLGHKSAPSVGAKSKI